MKALIQRVKRASVTIGGELYSQIQKGLLIFVCVEKGDDKAKADWIAEKTAKLRIFEDETEKMNKSLTDIKGEALIVSQFTLASDCKKGTRPSFDKSETPDKANELYEHFINKMQSMNIPVKTGEFAAMMEVGLINDGPVTFMIEK